MFKILQRRLGQYGAIWFAVFAAVLAFGLVWSLLLHRDIVAAADGLLISAFILLGLVTIGFLVATLVERASLATKIVLLLLGVFLILPLLWSPVLAVVVVAKFSNGVIEYSNSYAQFRIMVSKIVFPVFQSISNGSLEEAAWSGFQTVATVIGFAASLITLVPLLRRAVAHGPTAAEYED